MSPTHIAAGVAVSLAVLQPHTLPGVCVAVGGASIGSVLCDTDADMNRQRRDAVQGWITAAVLAAAAFVGDGFVDADLQSLLVTTNPVCIALGIAIFVATTFASVCSNHRTFGHSLLACTLWAIATALVCPSLVPALVCGLLSHLVLDLLNKKDLQLLWPFKFGRISFGLCKSNGLANSVLCLIFALVVLALLYLLLSPTS